MSQTTPQTAFDLNLSGNRWFIRAGDEFASSYVALLAEVMSLPPATLPPQRCPDGSWRELRVVTDSGADSTAAGPTRTGPVFCLLPPPRTDASLVIGMSLLALAVARAELARGGLLIHGALAAAPENISGGIILAGPAEVGKTTASNRLPPPWRSLSDDTTLVVRDNRGQYIAHPWPTWSRVFSAENDRRRPDGKWNVQEGIPLRAIFFLRQAATDQIEALPAAHAVTFLMDTVQLVSSLMTWDLTADRIQALHASQFVAVEELVRTIPAYALHLSLTGTFWNDIEATLPSKAHASPFAEGHPPADRSAARQRRSAAQAGHANETITVCYSGSSMNPTLRHQDIVEVIPYTGAPVRQGDIVYYPSPPDGEKVIHRAVHVTADGIFTRGDNNPTVDPYILQDKDIIGRVAAAWRNGRCRNIAGGVEGSWSGYHARARSRLHKIFSPLLHAIYHGLSASFLLRFLRPPSLRPRVFAFKQRHEPSLLKVIVNGRVIGRYNAWKKHWEIDRPWRLLIDVSQLPVAACSSAPDPPLPDHAAAERTVPD